MSWFFPILDQLKHWLNTLEGVLEHGQIFQTQSETITRSPISKNTCLLGNALFFPLFHLSSASPTTRRCARRLGGFFSVIICREPSPTSTTTCVPSISSTTRQASRTHNGAGFSKALHVHGTELCQEVGSSYGCWILTTTLNIIISSSISDLQ